MTLVQTDPITPQTWLNLHGSYCVIFARALRRVNTDQTLQASILITENISKMNCQGQIKRRKVRFYTEDKFKIQNPELIAIRV